jgi:phage gp46-like protein
MTDVRIVQYKGPFEITLDWFLTPFGMLDESQELATAVIVALGTDRLAGADDILPQLDSTDRRGWWGDIDAEVIWGGWTIGTRCWLLSRTKIVGVESAEGATTARADEYIREAIRPFIDNRIASQMQVDVERTGVNRIDANVTLYRGPLPAVALLYQLMWDEQQQAMALPNYYVPES